MRAGRGASISSRSAGWEGGRLTRICRLEDTEATLLRLCFRRASLLFGDLVGSADLLRDPLLDLPCLSGLLRLRGCTARRRGAGLGQATAAQAG